MIDLLILFLISAASLPVATQIMRGAGALFMSFLVTVLIAILGATVHVLIDVPIWAVWLIFGPLASVMVFLFPKTRQRSLSSLGEIRADLNQRLQAVLFAAVAILTALSIQPPLKWDARSIWFHHASWLNGPASYFLEAQYLPAGAWPDYPFAGPAYMALTWQLTFTEENLWLATQAIALATLAAAALTGSLLIARFGAGKSPWVNSVIFLLLLVSVTQIADGYFNAGYQDAFQAATVAALAISMLNIRANQVKELLVPAAAFLVAVNIKQEGFWFALGVILVGVSYQLGHKRFLALTLLGLALTHRLAWGQFADLIEMPENSHTSRVIANLLSAFSGEMGWNAKFLELMTTWGIPVSGLFFALVILASIGLLVGVPTSKEKVLLTAATVLLSAGLYLTATLTFVFGESHDFQWWLGTAYTRVTSTFEFVVLALAGAAAMNLSPWLESNKPPARSAMSGKAKKKARG